MKNHRMPAFLLLLSLAASPAAGQHMHGQMGAAQDTTGAQGMMHGQGTGMMHDGQNMGMTQPMTEMHSDHMQMMTNMMDDPLARGALTIRMLPAMKGYLELTDRQIESLSAVRESYEAEVSELEQAVRSTEQELEALLASSESDPEKISSLLRRAGTLRADLSGLGYKKARDARQVLSDEQIETLSQITPMQMHHQMMTALSMMEMMRMMSPGGMAAMNCPMMQSGMMNMMGGMMEPGGS